MKKYFIFLILIVSLLTSCSQYYKEAWIIERYPVEWRGEEIVAEEHLHFKDQDCQWRCFYDQSDTIRYVLRDTLELYIRKSN